MTWAREQIVVTKAILGTLAVLIELAEDAAAPKEVRDPLYSAAIDIRNTGVEEEAT